MFFITTPLQTRIYDNTAIEIPFFCYWIIIKLLFLIFQCRFTPLALCCVCHFFAIGPSKTFSGRPTSSSILRRIDSQLTVKVTAGSYVYICSYLSSTLPFMNGTQYAMIFSRVSWLFSLTLGLSPN